MSPIFACFCHRKSNEDAVKERRRVSGLFNMMEPSLLQFYISRQWLNKFKTFAEPGPISNDDFLCVHGGTFDNSMSSRNHSTVKLSLSLPSVQIIRGNFLAYNLLMQNLLSSLVWILAFWQSALQFLHSVANFKRGFYWSLCRWSFFSPPFLHGKRKDP